MNEILQMKSVTDLKPDEFYVISVKDELTGKFLNPAFAESLEAAKRLFAYQVNNTPVWKDNPSDFSLYHIGYFNQKSGMIIPEMNKLISGHAIRTHKEE